MRETIDNLRREAETAIRVLHSLKAFRLAVSKPEDVELINKNPDFWRIHEVSIRTHLFICIRRLYEGNTTTFNFQKFIELCIKNISSFSKEELNNRKSTSYKANEWIDSYMENVYEPSIDDFKKLAKVVRENSKKMKGVYIEAASTIYAHAVHLDHSTIVNITDQLNFDEMERALDSIWHCYEQVWQMYENGRKPIFEVTEYLYKEEVYDCFRKQLGTFYEQK